MLFGANCAIGLKLSLKESKQGIAGARLSSLRVTYHNAHLFIKPPTNYSSTSAPQYLGETFLILLHRHHGKKSRMERFDYLEDLLEREAAIISLSAWSISEYRACSEQVERSREYNHLRLVIFPLLLFRPFTFADCTKCMSDRGSSFEKLD